jgi:(p)ppGpp synthase/HD superfamily hydrolase
MIRYTERLDKALRTVAWSNERADEHRKGTGIPYVIHPVGVMMIASNVTDDEDILIACLFHDEIEDVSENIYDEDKMREEFGNRVVEIVKNVTKNENEPDWRARSNEYLENLEKNASDEAVIVSAADKIHNLMSILMDYFTYGEELWNRFTTKSSADQLWWYESILGVITRRHAPEKLIAQLSEQVDELKTRLNKP